MGKIYTVPEIKSTLYPLFKSYDIQKAVLFGSYVKGTAGTDSDIDLLVDSGLKGLRFVGFLDEVHSALDKDVDLFDVTHIVPGSVIDREIANSGVKIYEK